MPLTLHTPKVLLPVNGTPIIEHTILWLKSQGISEIVINVHHLAEQVMDYLGEGDRLGVQIVYSIEKDLLGTAGGVKKMAPFLGDNFLVICGDVYTNFDLSELIKLHQKKKAIATLALFKADNPWEVGIVSINDDGLISGFIEKPPRGSENGNLANGGVYALNKLVLRHIPGESYYDFGLNVFPKLTERRQPIYGYFLNDKDYPADIGTIENYEKVNEEVENTRH